MGAGIRLELPGLTRLNSADNVHWRTRQRERDLWLEQVCIALLQAKAKAHPVDWPRLPLDRARIYLVRRSVGREPDADNLAAGMKWILDALVKAGVIWDDSPAVIGTPTFAWEKAANRKEQAMVVKIDEAPAETRTCPTCHRTLPA